MLKKFEDRVIAEFFYDESGNRIKKVEDGVVSYYITKDYDIEDGEETVYYYANGARIARSSDEGTFWYLDDHLGSTNVMIDSNGELVEKTLYYPFGGHREGGTEKYTFTGKELDSEIGLYYYGARYYNPETFVFTQADTIIPDVYYPQSLNRYAYCYNNPVKYTDPDGHEPITLTTAAIIIGACIAGGILIGGVSNAISQYQETGDFNQIDWKDVGKSAAVGGVVGGAAGVVSVVAVAGIGASVVGTSGMAVVSAVDLAAVYIVDTIAIFYASFAVGIVSRGLIESANGGNGTEILREGFNGEEMLLDMGTSVIPGGSSGSTVANGVINAATSEATKQVVKNPSIVQKASAQVTATYQSAKETASNVVSSVSSAVNTTVNKVVNSATQAANSVTQSVKNIFKW